MQTNKCLGLVTSLINRVSVTAQRVCQPLWTVSKTLLALPYKIAGWVLHEKKPDEQWERILLSEQSKINLEWKNVRDVYYPCLWYRLLCSSSWWRSVSAELYRNKALRHLRPSMQILPFCSSVDGSSVLLCKFINGFCESLACFWGRRALIVPTHLNWEVLVHREGDSRLLLRNRHYFNNVCGVGDVVSWP